MVSAAGDCAWIVTAAGMTIDETIATRERPHAAKGQILWLVHALGCHFAPFVLRNDLSTCVTGFVIYISSCTGTLSRCCPTRQISFMSFRSSPQDDRRLIKSCIEARTA